jgi:predicted nuclease of predicted toxin-antitoxin system
MKISHMPHPTLLANMNISPQTVGDLCAAGWDTVRVSQLLPPTATDEEILELARNENRAVVTQDLDFSTLLALGGHDRPSLIAVRTTSSDPGFITQRLLNTLPCVEQQLDQGCVVTIEDASYRIRSLQIP